MNRTNAQKGFTIIETLVAITVLMIAIAGPLVVASRGLSSAQISKDQMIGSYLAQESLETVKNIRDNNLYTLGASSWLNGLSSCTYSSPCDASAFASPAVVTCGGSACQLYVETNGYGHTAVANAVSPFTRKFYIHGTSNTAACASSDECGLTAEVYWNVAGIPYSVVVTTEITSTLR